MPRGVVTVHRLETFTDLNPGGYQIEALETLLGQVIAWSDALEPHRKLPRAA